MTVEEKKLNSMPELSHIHNGPNIRCEAIENIVYGILLTTFALGATFIFRNPLPISCAIPLGILISAYSLSLLRAKAA